MKNLNQTNEFQVEKLEERLEMCAWSDAGGDPDLCGLDVPGEI